VVSTAELTTIRLASGCSGACALRGVGFVSGRRGIFQLAVNLYLQKSPWDALVLTCCYGAGVAAPTTPPTATATATATAGSGRCLAVAIRGSMRSATGGGSFSNAC
jgi:hypothetical protein